MATPKPPAPTEADAIARTEKEAADTAAGIPIHEDDYICDELSEEFGEDIWIHKPTGQPYFPDNKSSRIFARAPVLEHDHPLLEHLRRDFEM